MATGIENEVARLLEPMLNVPAGAVFEFNVLAQSGITL
jgi:hypothetical protein